MLRWTTPLLIAAALAVSSLFSIPTKFAVGQKTAPLVSSLAGAAAADGATGSLFLGEKVRSFTGKRRLLVHAKTVRRRRKQGDDNFSKMTNLCDQWAVVTTIHPPTEAVQSVAALGDWCLVIVGDVTTPSNYLEQLGLYNQTTRVFFLSADDQQQQQMPYAHNFVKLIPFRSFARKNVGFLFAIRHGARVIYDFDDDNVLMSGMAPLMGIQQQQQRVLESSKHDDYGDDDDDDDDDDDSLMAVRRVTVPAYSTRRRGQKNESLAFNPLPFMNPTQDFVWPRGLPLQGVKKSSTRLGAGEIVQIGSIKASSIGVIQSVCNGDPDFDAIYRLTRPLPVDFSSEKRTTALKLLIPAGRYTPYNAQATTHMYPAFWGLYLPWTVPGRVSDIWRSYFTQRILRDLDLALLYEPPLVTHMRSEHNYLADMQAEGALYMKTKALLEFLADWQWRQHKDNDDVDSQFFLPARIEALSIALYERSYIELEDVYGMQEWLLALLGIGYQFPVLPPK